jgi:hypothetical protein
MRFTFPPESLHWISICIIFLVSGYSATGRALEGGVWSQSLWIRLHYGWAAKHYVHTFLYVVSSDIVYCSSDGVPPCESCNAPTREP